MQYDRIKPINKEKNISSLYSIELKSLSKLWKEQKSKLENSDGYGDFVDKMHTE